MTPQQHFTQPPARYTEASLIKTLEEKGIGRPSTYAPIMDTIQNRNYVEKKDKQFIPTELGVIIVDLLKKYFARIINVSFTAHMKNPSTPSNRATIRIPTSCRNFMISLSRKWTKPKTRWKRLPFRSGIGTDL